MIVPGTNKCESSEYFTNSSKNVGKTATNKMGITVDNIQINNKEFINEFELLTCLKFKFNYDFESK